VARKTELISRMVVSLVVHIRNVMNFQTLDEELKCLWLTGNSLTLEERLQVELSLLELTQKEDFEDLLFWGKIKGVSRDYFLSLGLKYRGQYEFPLKRFFWCNSVSWSFAELPSVNPNDSAKADQFNSFFTGDHGKVLVEAPAEDENQPPAEEEDAKEKDSLASREEEKVPARAFTELDRLAVVVRAIEQDCQLVPQGAFRITPAHELSRSRAFAGLSRTEAKSLSCYLHFRNVQSQAKRSQLDRDDAIFTYDFLDPAEKDLPQPCWSLQTDSAKELINVRSLLWPGYVAYHRACTPRFGGAYIGNGIKNVDLVFML